MSGIETYTNSVLTERWDDSTRTYIDFRTDPDTTRPYSVEENAGADERAAKVLADGIAASTSSKLVTTDFPAMQAIILQTNADLRADPSQEIKDIARAVRRLTRKVENLTDGSD